MAESIQKVMVIGCGVMGRGILASFASTGFDCTVIDTDPEALSNLPAGARAVDAFPEEAPDLVVEAIPEFLDQKLDLFRRLDAAYGAKPILTSNTSALPLQELAAVVGRPDRFCGLHYFQPADTFDFVELIQVAETTDDVVAAVDGALRGAGKQALLLKRPIDGFLVNRLQHAILHEAYFMISEGIVDVEAVDTVAKNLLGPRMSVTGLIQQKDISGLVTHASVQRSVVPTLHHSAEPNPFVQDMVAAGNTGAAGGRGFYDWSQRDLPAFKKEAAARLARILEIVREPWPKD